MPYRPLIENFTLAVDVSEIIFLMMKKKFKSEFNPLSEWILENKNISLDAH